MTLSQADIDSLLGPQSAGSVESLLDTKLSGEDIANALQDPNFTPTQEQYQLFEDYNKTRQTDWLQSLLTAADTVVQTAGAAGKAALTTGAAFNPKNYVEGLAQGTAQLYGLVAQSQDPDSALFKLNNLISGTGTLENRYGQFLEARQFNKDLDAYAKGDMSIMFKPEDLNPEFVQGVAMVADPTMFVPGVGQLLGAEKVAAKALGKAVGVAGKGVQAISKPVERLSAATGRFVTEATGISPEALRGAATTSGVLAATGVGPAIGAVGAVPFIAEAATDVGRALESAGAQMGMTPTRIGALEAVGAIPEANMRQRIIGTIGRYGGDAALRTALAGTAGTLEGAALGGALGYLSGGEEGAASGIGSGGVAGALGSLGARGLQTLTGSEAKAARLNDLNTYVDTLAPEKKAAYQSVQERFGTDTAANLMDLESLIKGTRGDIGVEILRGDEFKKRAGVTARGVVPDENAATPRILINVDAMPKVKGDSPIYTLGHELLHALAKTKQFQGDVTGFVETLTGAYVPNPDGTVRLVSEGQYSPAKVEQLFNDYVKQLPEDARANVISANPTASDRAVYVGEELAAEQVGRILSSQKPDAFLRGFGSTRQNFTDMLLLQEASRVGSKIGQLIERTFGITPTDSVLFPEIKNASPAIDAALRRLLKARENIDEALLNADYQKSFKIDQKAISDPVAADYAVRGGFAERLPTGEVRLLTNGELLQRETRDVTALKQIIDGLPGAKIDINGEVVGDLSPEQLDAIKGSSVSSQMQQRLEMTNRSINEGRSLFVEYYPATEKVQDPTSKRWRTKYASRRVTFREVLPYNLLLSKENNSYVRAIDLTQVRKSLQRSIRPDGSVGGLWSNVGEFLGELNAYLSNLDRKENAIPSRKIFGPDKAEFFGNFMNSLEKGGSEFIHSFRLDRMGQMDPSDFRAKFSESAYRKMKDRFMPAGSVGEEQAWKSGAGFTILTSGNKFRLYGPEGKLLGIYDSAEQAQRKSNATKTRLQPENDQLQYPTRNEVGQTAEAGNRNRALDRTQGGQEGGQANRQVRQEGDVRFMPDVDPDLIALHNTSEEGIRAALSLGGIPVPSIGITKKNTAFTGYGDITLIADRSTIDPQLDPRNKVFSSDVYSPRQPRPHQSVKRGAGDKVYKKMQSLIPEGFTSWSEIATGEKAHELIVDKGPDNVAKTIDKLSRSSDVMAAFLSEQGVAVPRITQEPSLRNRLLSNETIKDPRLNVLRQHKDDLSSFINTPEGIAIGDIVRDIALDPYSSDPNMMERARRNLVSRVGEYGTELPFSEAAYLQSDLETVASAKKEIDRYAIKDWLTEQVANKKPEFDKWITNLVADVFDPQQFIVSGKTKKPYTLENLVGQMTRKVLAQEGGMTYSLGKARASSASTLPTVEAMRSASGSLTDSSKMKEFKDSLSKEFSDIAETMSTYDVFSSVFDRMDRLSEAVGKIAKRPTSASSVLSRADFKDVPVDVVKRVQAFAEKLNKAPTEYFEAKPQRAVGINEFKAAVVPESTSPEVVNALKQSGLTVETYKGSEDRVATVERVSGERNLRFMPSDSEYLSAVQAGDTAKAQELVDQAAKAAGYTVGPVYHGTSAEFTEFKRGDLGIHFGTKEQASGRGGTREIRAFLKAKPIRIDDDPGFWMGRKIVNLLSDQGVNKTELTKLFNKAASEGGSSGEPNSSADILARGLIELGIDSIQYPNKFEGVGDSVVVLDPSQIKSADPITRDDAGNVIPLSQRFQQSSADIRYMPAPVPDPSIPGAYSMSGYRILPGKTKSKLRVYSPDGSLAGVVGSVDDAQRMIQKKLQ